jgi:hypothetical protein
MSSTTHQQPFAESCGRNREGRLAVTEFVEDHPLVLVAIPAERLL